MHITTEDNNYILVAQGFQMLFHQNRPFVSLMTRDGKPIADLFAPSSVHTTLGLDDSTRNYEWAYTQSATETVFSQCVESNIWAEKVYRFRCTENRFTYEIEVCGTGQITDVLYFGGYYSGTVRWGSGLFWSGQHFKQCFNPEPTAEETFYFSPRQGSVIDLCGVPLPGRGDWFFTPPPFCFAAEVGEQWLAMGLEAAVCEHNFTSFQYRAQAQSGFCLIATFDGYTQVNGRLTLPTIGFDFGTDAYHALQQHVNAYYQRLDTPLKPPQPKWWSEPIYCGWGSQCYLASLDKQPAPQYARQEHYETFLTTLEANDLNPGIVVLDDKWQATYGDNCVDTEKWTDIRGFIDSQHAKGRHVLLWLKAWDAEGLPLEECIRNIAGIPLSVDPTNPAFEARFRDAIRRMLSPDGYNADGFKIDFTARIPASPALQMCENVWGLELMKRYLHIIYDEAKKTKPDALVMTHTPHPYLADVTDMIRLNDINIGKDVLNAMQHRARVAKIACPDLLIDTDNWPITDLQTWREYVALQPQLGIPSLYCVSHIDNTGEPLTADDYQLLREVWKQYRQQVEETTP